MTHIKEAFNKVCSEAKKSDGFYVSLIARVPYYGGPEEGGWWGSDTLVKAYQRFTTEEQAETAKEAVEKLALELSKQAKREFGEQCLRELEAFGYDNDLAQAAFGEPDGEESYFVQLSKEIPEDTFGPRHYE